MGFGFVLQPVTSCSLTSHSMFPDVLVEMRAEDIHKKLLVIKWMTKTLKTYNFHMT